MLLTNTIVLHIEEENFAFSLTSLKRGQKLTTLWLELKLKFRNYKIAISSKADHPQMHVFLVTWQICHSIRHSWKPHTACKLHGSIFYRTRVIASWSFVLQKWAIFTFFAAVTLTMTFTRWPSYTNLTTWPCIHRSKTNFLCLSRLLKVIVLHTYIQTDIQTGATENITLPLFGW